MENVRARYPSTTADGRGEARKKDESYLHAQQGEDHDKKEEQKQQRRDRLYGV